MIKHHVVFFSVGGTRGARSEVFNWSRSECNVMMHKDRALQLQYAAVHCGYCGSVQCTVQWHYTVQFTVHCTKLYNVLYIGQCSGTTLSTVQFSDADTADVADNVIQRLPHYSTLYSSLLYKAPLGLKDSVPKNIFFSQKVVTMVVQFFLNKSCLQR